MCVSSTIQEKIDPASWLARKAGYAGAVNPAADLERAIERKTPGISRFVESPTKTERLAESMNRSQSRQIALQKRFTGASAHAVNISRAQSGIVRSTVAPIAGRTPGS